MQTDDPAVTMQDDRGRYSRQGYVTESIHGLLPSRRPWLGWLAALLAVVVSTLVRVETARADPNFSQAPVEGLLKSDPGLAYYVVERILDARGGVPDDFRADPRIEHPDLVDVPSRMPVGLQFIAAWTQLLLAQRPPLIETCLWVSSACASLVLLGVFGLARELSGRTLPAVLAVVCAAAMFANHRTIGFVLTDEDLALPLFAAHLWLAARAYRVRSTASVIAAALFLVAALASWHAMSFFASLEAGALLIWFAVSGRNPLPHQRAWPLVIILAAAGIVVPLLAEAGFLLSFPMLVVVGLCGASGVARLRGGGEVSRLPGFSSVAVLVAAAFLLGRVVDTGAENHAHVFALLVSKIGHLGVLPADPRELSFDARLMWQGPFRTMGWGELLVQLGLPLLALPAMTVVLRRARGSTDPRVVVAVILAWISLPAAWLVARTIVLPGMILPALVACWAVGSRRNTWIAASGAGVQILFFAGQIRDHQMSWYWPYERQVEIARVVHAVRLLVPAGEPVAGDFMTSTAILARTRHPIVFQPKWESKASRDRVREFLTTLYEKPPGELRDLLLDTYRCKYLVVDCYTLWNLARYTAGMPLTAREPPVGTAAHSLLSKDARALESIPGYRLLYRSPNDLRQPDGRPTDFYRVYELTR